MRMVMATWIFLTCVTREKARWSFIKISAKNVMAHATRSTLNAKHKRGEVLQNVPAESLPLTTRIVHHQPVVAPNMPEVKVYCLWILMAMQTLIFYSPSHPALIFTC